MTRRSLAAPVWVLSVAALVGACSEPAHVPTQARVAAAVQSASTSCSFNSMNPSISQFFTSSAQQKTVKGLQSTMQNAWSVNDTAATRNAGYDMFSQIAAAVSGGAVGSVSAGSTLTNQVTACMFWSTSQLPADFPHDYTTELTPSAQGAIAVRGGSLDDTVAVLARGTSPISGLDAQDGYTWTESLSGVVPPSRVLFYGEPGTIPNSYDWKAIPANATFSPRLVVGLCDPGGAYMIYESDGNILPYVTAPFLDGSCPTTASSSTTLWQRAFAMGRHMAAAVLLPPSAHAAMALSGLGGTSGGFSTFSTYNVGTVTIGYTVQPHDADVLPSVCPATVPDSANVGPVTFQVTKNGIAVGGTAITLTQINNNGTPAALCGNTSGVTDANGYLTLNGIGLTKTGAYQLVASGMVPGRTVNSTGGMSTRFNIRP